jgi:hypothetical protein
MIQEHSETRATIRCDRPGCTRSRTTRLNPARPCGVVAQCCDSAVKAGWRVPEDPDQPDVCVGCLNNDTVEEYLRMVEATR